MSGNASNDRIMTLSIAGGTGWAAETVLHCPHEHYLRYEQGFRIKKMPKPLAFGILIHDSVFTNDFDRFRTGWERGTILNDRDEAAWPIDRAESEVEDDIDLAELMFNEVQKQDLQIKEVETKMETPIIDPDNGETPSHLEGVFVSGRRDMIESYNGSEDQSDLKTAARSWPEHQARGSIQLPTYRYLEACTGLPTHDTGHYLVITKTKKPKFQRNTIKMGDSDYFAVYTKFRAAAEAILKYREAAKNAKEPAKCWSKTGPCIGMYGQLCRYHPICFPERYDNPEEIVNETLQARV